MLCIPTVKRAFCGLASLKHGCYTMAWCLLIYGVAEMLYWAFILGASLFVTGSLKDSDIEGPSKIKYRNLKRMRPIYVIALIFSLTLAIGCVCLLLGVSKNMPKMLVVFIICSMIRIFLPIIPLIWAIAINSGWIMLMVSVLISLILGYCVILVKSYHKKITTLPT